MVINRRNRSRLNILESGGVRVFISFSRGGDFVSSSCSVRFKRDPWTSQ